MLRTARVWQLGADPQQSALFTGRVPAAEAYRLACERRDAIVHHRDDTLNAEALQRTGAVLVRGHGQLREPGVLDVDGRTLRYRELVINTGSVPSRPDIPGLESVPTWTSDDALSTTELPSSMLILGGGAVGCELAFLFATFGAAVTLVQRGSRLLPLEEPRASVTVEQALTDLGVTIFTNVTVTEVVPRDDRTCAQLSNGQSVTVERVVLAVGRLPNSAGLGLSNVGLNLGGHAAIPIDDHCRVVGASPMGDRRRHREVGVHPHLALPGPRWWRQPPRTLVRADYAAIPRAVYVEPTLASVRAHPCYGAPRRYRADLRSAEMRTAAVRSSTDGQAAAGSLVGRSSKRVSDRCERDGPERRGVDRSLRKRSEPAPVALLADVVHPFPSFGEVLENPLWELREACRHSPPTVSVAR